MPFRLVALTQTEGSEELSREEETRLRELTRSLKPQVVYHGPHPAARAAARLVAQELGAEAVQEVAELGLDPEAKIEVTRQRRPSWGDVLVGILRRRPPRPRIAERIGRTGLEVFDEKLTELWRHNRQMLVLVASARLIQAYLGAHQRYRREEMGAPLGSLELVVATYPDPYIGSGATLELPGRDVELPLGTLK